jgi:D-glycerate 3-kinase
MLDTVASLSMEHILQQFSAKKYWNSESSPLFVAIQGPPGIGKTTLARALVAGLSSSPYSLKVVTFSIDDLMFGYDTMRVIGQAHPGNTLLQGRGLPGTHDIELGIKTLNSLSKVGRNTIKGSTETVCILMYDKSSYTGLGDQVPMEKWEVIQSLVDVIIVEGWCLGCFPLPSDLLADRWDH